VVQFKKPFNTTWDGPLLVALDQDGAAVLRVPLPELERAASQVVPVTRRNPDDAPLYRVVELLDCLHPVRAEQIRSANTPSARSAGPGT
jgi:hypothetical protein